MRFLLRVLIGCMLAVVCVFGAVQQVGAVTQQGDIEIGGVVPGPPPAVAPTIIEPEAERTFSEKNIEIKGECLADLRVRIFRNDEFAGSTVCQTDGQYTIAIDLQEGKNKLLARQYDALNQPSPDSAELVVYYVPPRPELQLPSAPSQSVPAPAVAEFELAIEYDFTLQGVFAGKPFTIPIQFAGGKAPYAISVDWGDGTTSVFNREDAQRFLASHTYRHGGQYIVKIRVSDANGHQAYLQFVAVVNGIPENIVTRAFESTVEAGGWWTSMVMVSMGVAVVSFIGGIGVAQFLLRLRWFGKRLR